MSIPSAKPDRLDGRGGTTVLECVRILMTRFNMRLADPAVDAPFPFTYDKDECLARVPLPFPYPPGDQRQWLRQLEMLIAAPSLPPAASILWDATQLLDPENGLSALRMFRSLISQRAAPRRSTPQSRWAVLLHPNALAGDYFVKGCSDSPESLINLRVFLHEQQAVAWLTRAEGGSAHD
jgi:hypothetical protein